MIVDAVSAGEDRAGRPVEIDVPMDDRADSTGDGFFSCCFLPVLVPLDEDDTSVAAPLEDVEWGTGASAVGLGSAGAPVRVEDEPRLGARRINFRFPPKEGGDGAAGEPVIGEPVAGDAPSE